MYCALSIGKNSMEKTETKKYLTGMNPRGYHNQTHICCCANCDFGGYIGYVNEPERMCICEIMGECTDSDYAAIAVEPLAVCDAYRPSLQVKYNEDDE